MVLDAQTRRQSLQELEHHDWGEPAFPSHLVTTCHRLRRVPLEEFTGEDLRIMIGQGIGLPYLIPLAIERLRENPALEGDYGPGDVLWAIMRVTPAFWTAHPDLRAEAEGIVDSMRDFAAQFQEYLPAFEGSL